eukprot:6338911-Prymnesium_polylepis.1
MVEAHNAAMHNLNQIQLQMASHYLAKKQLTPTRHLQHNPSTPPQSNRVPPSSRTSSAPPTLAGMLASGKLGSPKIESQTMLRPVALQPT